jgi:hypothetical protein
VSGKTAPQDGPAAGETDQDAARDDPSTGTAYLGMGVTIGIGTGIGIALGTALGNVALGVALGAGLGTVVGAILQSGRKRH